MYDAVRETLDAPSLIAKYWVIKNLRDAKNKININLFVLTL